MGIVESTRHKAPRTPFQLKVALPALRDSLLEILLPLLILFLFLRGVMTLVETAAFSVLYAFVAEVVVHRDIKLRDVPSVFLKSVAIMGGVLVILWSANGLSYYLVDAQLPTRMVTWVTRHQLAHRVPPPREPRAACRGVVPGDLFVHHDRGAAHRAPWRCIRGESPAPGDHFPGEHGAGIPDAARRAESLPVLVQVRATPCQPLPGRAPASLIACLPPCWSSRTCRG